MRFSVLALTLGLLMSKAADVSALETSFPSKQCNSCTSSQREAAAIVQPGPNGRHVYVHDLTSGVLYKYQIESEPIPGGYAYYAYTETVESQ